MSATDQKSLAIIPTDIGGFVDLAGRFAKSALLPDGLRAKPDDVFVTLLAGHELGLAPMAALRGIHVIKGKPILTADTMVAVVLSSGAAEYFTRVDESDESATYETKRKGAPSAQRATWTLADAKRAGLLGNDNWLKNPRAMCRARAKSILARDVYPDVLAGCYEEGEAEEVMRDQIGQPTRLPVGTTIIDAPATAASPPPAPKTPADTWPALLADLAPLVDDATCAPVGKPIEAWTEADVKAAMNYLLDGCKTPAEADAKIGPWGRALNKHARPGSKAAALYASFRDAFKTWRDKLKAEAAEGETR